MKNELQPLESKQEVTQVENFLARWDEWDKLATHLLKSQFLPKHFTTKEQVLLVIFKGRELNLPPMESLQGLYPVNGRIGMMGQLAFALIRRSGELEAWNFVFEPGVCKCMLKRKGQQEYWTEFSLQDADKAGLSKGDNWKKYEKDMLQWRAFARNVKVSFPDILTGINLMEEIDDIKYTEDGEPVISFDPDAEYHRMFDSLRKLDENKKTTFEDLNGWMDLNKSDLMKLNDKRQQILNRLYTQIVKKFPTDVNFEDVKEKENGTSRRDIETTTDKSTIDTPAVEDRTNLE